MTHDIDKLIEEEVTPKIDKSKTYANVNFVKFSTKIKQLVEKEEKTQVELEECQKNISRMNDQIRGFGQQINSMR